MVEQNNKSCFNSLILKYKCKKNFKETAYLYYLL